jgi:tetratricopeptide (TPR) repeat protein
MSISAIVRSLHLLQQEQFKALRDQLLKSAAAFYGKLSALLGQETDPASRRALAESNFELAGLAGQVGRREDALAAHRAVGPRRVQAVDDGPGHAGRAVRRSTMSAKTSGVGYPGDIKRVRQEIYRRNSRARLHPNRALSGSPWRQRLDPPFGGEGREGEARRMVVAPHLGERMMPEGFADRMRMGGESYERGDLSAARVHFEAALQLDSGSTVARYNLGVVYRDLELSEDAWIHFLEVISRDNRAAGAFNNLAILEERLGYYRAAEVHYRRAVALKHEFPDAHFNLGMLLLRLGRFPEHIHE